jgi:hypothetical protein
MDENENYLKTRKYDIESYRNMGAGNIFYNEDRLVLCVHKRDEYYKNYKNHYSKLYNARKVYND